MRIYFIDGLIKDFPLRENATVIDICFGKNKCLSKFAEAQGLGMDVITNCTYLLNRCEYEANIPLLYFLIEGEWVNVSMLTTRYVKQGTNVEHLFLAGEFDKIPTEEEKVEALIKECGKYGILKVTLDNYVLAVNEHNEWEAYPMENAVKGMIEQDAVEMFKNKLKEVKGE